MDWIDDFFDVLGLPDGLTLADVVDAVSVWRAEKRKKKREKQRKKKTVSQSTCAS